MFELKPKSADLLPSLTARQTSRHIEAMTHAVAELSIPPLNGKKKPACTKKVHKK